MSSDLVVALTGASGSQYGVRLVEALLRAGRTVHLAISPAAVEVFDREIGRSLQLGEAEFDPRAFLGPRADGLDLTHSTITISETSKPVSRAGRFSRREWRFARAAWGRSRRSLTAFPRISFIARRMFT